MSDIHLEITNARLEGENDGLKVLLRKAEAEIEKLKSDIAVEAVRTAQENAALNARAERLEGHLKEQARTALDAIGELHKTMTERDALAAETEKQRIEFEDLDRILANTNRERLALAATIERVKAVPKRTKGLVEGRPAFGDGLVTYGYNEALSDVELALAPPKPDGVEHE